MYKARQRLQRVAYTTLITVFLSIFVGRHKLLAEAAVEPLVKLRYFKVESIWQGYLGRILAGVEMEKWPKSTTLRVAPIISSSLLSDANSLTSMHETLGLLGLSDDVNVGGRGRWAFSWLKKNLEEPRDLPEEYRRVLTKNLPAAVRRDPELLREYLARKLDQYKRSKAYSSIGQLHVDLCLAPNCDAACEYLIYDYSWCTVPVEAVINKFLRTKQDPNLGTVSFVNQSSRCCLVMFVRDNIAVIIWAEGELASQGLPLAKKIDELILKQPVLTYQQLLARRPTITIVQEPIRTDRYYKNWDVPIKVTAPDGAEIASVKAYVDGNPARLWQGKVHISNKTGPVNIKVTAVTTELLANTVQQQVLLPGR